MYRYETDNNGNTIWRVSQHDTDSASVHVQGEGDHPNARRARARRAVREVLGEGWVVGDYYGAAGGTHVNDEGKLYGSLHLYAVHRVA